MADERASAWLHQSAAGRRHVRVKLFRLVFILLCGLSGPPAVAAAAVLVVTAGGTTRQFTSDELPSPDRGAVPYAPVARLRQPPQPAPYMEGSISQLPMPHRSRGSGEALPPCTAGAESTRGASLPQVGQGCGSAYSTSGLFKANEPH